MPASTNPDSNPHGQDHARDTHLSPTTFSHLISFFFFPLLTKHHQKTLPRSRWGTFVLSRSPRRFVNTLLSIYHHHMRRLTEYKIVIVSVKDIKTFPDSTVRDPFERVFFLTTPEKFSSTVHVSDKNILSVLVLVSNDLNYDVLVSFMFYSIPPFKSVLFGPAVKWMKPHSHL